MPDASADRFNHLLEPMDRISEVLFGLIMALTFTCTLGVVTADTIQVRTMLFAALGCNLAWGSSMGVYLLARLNENGRKIKTMLAMRAAPDSATAQRIIADELSPLVASVLPPEQLEFIRQKLNQMPEHSRPPRLTRRDGLAALAICLLSFLSTFPIVIPFILIGDAKLALRISNVVAIAMLFLCGYALGYHSGFRPWAMACSMVAIGSALVGVAIALGG
jgi:VIT1/CCC1 family predicted Fe2+/Mn2+ transporter